MRTQNQTTGAGNTTAAQIEAGHIYRASIDTKVVGHFKSMSAAMKVLTAEAIESADGYNGYVDVYDPNNEIMPMKGAEDDGYKCMRHRVVRGGDAGCLDAVLEFTKVAVKHAHMVQLARKEAADPQPLEVPKEVLP